MASPLFFCLYDAEMWSLAAPQTFQPVIRLHLNAHKVSGLSLPLVSGDSLETRLSVLHTKKRTASLNVDGPSLGPSTLLHRSVPAPTSTRKHQIFAI